MLFLFLLFGVVRAEVCTNLDGSAINTAACQCGTSTCDVDTGLICYAGGGGSCRKTTPGTFGFQTVVSGRCDVLLGNSQCDLAAADTGKVYHGTFPETSKPHGCYLYSPSGAIIFNTLSTTVDCSSGFPCICAAAEDCVDGENSAACACGTALCTESTGLFCNSSLSHCGTEPIVDCEFTNGEMNDAACLCGSTVCNTYTGLICYAGGGGSCRKTNPGAFGYQTVVSGSCSGDYRPIGDMVACQEVVNMMGQDKTVNTFSHGMFPPGCIRLDNAVYFNTLSTSVDCSSSAQCICVAVEDCVNGANSAQCQCGTSTCLYTGNLCDSQTSTCSAPACTNTDGSAANSNSCTCGTSTCTEDTGLFCDNNQCGPQCESGWNEGCFNPSTEGCSIRDMSLCSAAELINIKTLYNNREQC
jgi:hypothetical protein